MYKCVINIKKLYKKFIYNIYIFYSSGLFGVKEPQFFFFSKAAFLFLQRQADKNTRETRERLTEDSNNKDDSCV